MSNDNPKIDEMKAVLAKISPGDLTKIEEDDLLARTRAINDYNNIIMDIAIRYERAITDAFVYAEAKNVKQRD